MSSNTAVFPLPASTPGGAGGPGGPLANGIHGGLLENKEVLGSDESLGGALLTPIPWLRSHPPAPSSAGSSSGSSSGSAREIKHESEEMIDGPNGAGRIETVTVINGVLTTTPIVPSNSPAPESAAATPTETRLRDEGAVTQGELLRQEQEAGVVTIGHPAGRANETEEHPHARGPDSIDAEDVGPQERPIGSELDIDAAVGRTAHRASLSPEMGRAASSFDEDKMDVGKDDAEDEDFTLVDADDSEKEQERKGTETGDNTATDTIDTTTG